METNLLRNSTLSDLVVLLVALGLIRLTKNTPRLEIQNVLDRNIHIFDGYLGQLLRTTDSDYAMSGAKMQPNLKNH